MPARISGATNSGNGKRTPINEMDEADRSSWSLHCDPAQLDEQPHVAAAGIGVLQPRRNSYLATSHAHSAIAADRTRVSA